MNNLNLKLKIAWCSLLTILSTTGMRASNYYVNSTTGNDSNTGLTTGTAKKTLSWFSNSTTFLKPGDTVFVMNGTYTNGTTTAVLSLKASGTTAQPIVIKNYPGHSPLLKFNNWDGILMSGGIHDIVIDGLKVQGNNKNCTLSGALNQGGSCNNPSGALEPAYNGNGILADGRTNGTHVHHITVRNCTVFECGGGGIVSLQADYLTFENNIIYNTSWYTIYGSSGISNLSSWNYDNHTASQYAMIIRNNIVYGNQLFVPWKDAPCKITDGNGIIIDSQTSSYTGNTLIENNVVYQNGGRGIHVFKSDNITIRNNSCFFNCKSVEISDGEITITGNNVSVHNNIMYARTGERANYKNSSSTGFSSGNNLIFNATASLISFTNASDIVGKDPQFIDTTLATANFQLKNTSPAINAGTNVSGQYSVKDINGITRDNKPDIGAYEKLIATEINTLIKTNNTFNVYPNPANEYVTVEGINTDSKIELYDVLGKRVYSKMASTYITKIDISDLEQGIYFLIITVDNGLVQSYKIVKNI